MHIWEHMMAKYIVAIGAGRNIAEVAQYCREHGATLHCVSSAITPELQDVLTAYGDVMQFHHTSSLSAVPNLQQADLILMNNKHDWPNILRELRTFTDNALSWPTVLMLDTEEAHTVATHQQDHSQELANARKKQRITQEKLLIMQERVTHLEQQLSYVNCSCSWRWTQPLRTFAHFLKTLRR